jgi:hypothetical protein
MFHKQVRGHLLRPKWRQQQQLSSASGSSRHAVTPRGDLRLFCFTRQRMQLATYLQALPQVLLLLFG